ncbi:MAG TPA: acetylxylan esterase, partial [Vicinamibacterales bacterium]
MARLVSLVLAAALAGGGVYALSSSPILAQNAPSAPVPDITASSAPERFAQWLDAEAARAMEAGARARRELSSADQVKERAEAARRIVLDAMGGLPETRTPLNARITGGFEREGYRVEHLVFESLPGLFVTATVYVPTGRPGPFPAVLGTAGHSDDGKAAPIYQHAWISFARRGMIVLAYDPPAQGERLEDLDPATGKPRVGSGTQAHSHAGQQCLLTGTSIARYFAWDGVRALDYLLTRSDVDPSRIAVAGNSGGGTQATWLAAVEPRLAAVVSSCYITSWPELWKGPGPQDMEQVLPGFLAHGLDFADAILAAAPRPYLVSSAIRDFFPIAGARDTVAQTRRLYLLLGAAERLHQVETDATHGWSQPLREGAYEWFGRWGLAAAGSGASEGTVTVEPVEHLRATPTGQIETSFGTRTIFDYNLDRARELTRTRTPVTRDRLRQFLGIPSTLPAPAVVRREPDDGNADLRTE